MSKEVLGPALKAAMDGLTNDEKRDRDKIFLALADAVIKHLQTFGEVQATVLPGLTTAPGGGPVTGVLIVPPGGVK